MTIYGHHHSSHATVTDNPPLDNAPRVPRNITHSRINNFLSDGGQFHGMGIHRGLWKLRKGGPPHVELKVYSVPELKVNLYIYIYFSRFFTHFFVYCSVLHSKYDYSYKRFRKNH